MCYNCDKAEFEVSWEKMESETANRNESQATQINLNNIFVPSKLKNENALSSKIHEDNSTLTSAPVTVSWSNIRVSLPHKRNLITRLKKHSYELNKSAPKCIINDGIQN